MFPLKIHFLGGNELSGFIPSEFGNLQSLEVINVGKYYFITIKNWY